MTDETIHASLKRTGDRVSVSIDQNDQEKAGIAHLEYHLVFSKAPDGGVSVGLNTEDHRDDSGRVPWAGAPAQLSGLEQGLDRKREQLEALQPRIQELRLRKNKYGRAFPAGEAVELREAEEEEQKLNDEILRLKAQLRMEKKSLVDDPRPQERVAG